MKPRFSDKQITQIIKEQETGERAADVSRRHEIRAGTFYNYKAKFGGMESSDANRLRALEDEGAVRRTAQVSA